MRSTLTIVLVAGLCISTDTVRAQVAQQAAPDIAQLTTDCDDKKLAACVQLAHAYRDGKGVTRDSKRGEELYRRACDGGDGGGCLGLTWYTLPAKRGAMYKKACDFGSMPACGSLAYMYDHGQDGLERNWDAGTALYRRLCEGGDARVCGYYMGPDPQPTCTMTTQFSLVESALNRYERSGNHATNAGEDNLKRYFAGAEGCEQFHLLWGRVHAMRRDWPTMEASYQKAITHGDRTTYNLARSLTASMDHAAAPDGFRNELKTKDAPVPAASAPHFDAIVKAALERWKNDSSLTALAGRVPKP